MKNKRWPLFLAAATTWLATVAATDEVPLSAADRRAVVEQLGQTLEANYVYPDKARIIAATLRRNLDAGDYDTAHDRAALARELTDDLISASNDLHFAVGVDPARSGTARRGAEEFRLCGPALPRRQYRLCRPDAFRRSRARL